ncbi:MAG: hypothetical protein ACPF87_02450 [Flavobacteriales bacterium]
MLKQNTFWLVGLVGLAALVACDPVQERGGDLPALPTAEVNWHYLYTLDLPDSVVRDPSTTDFGATEIPNHIVVEAEASDDVFMQLWDFGNGKISEKSVDTMFYVQRGFYPLTYQAQGPGGMYQFQDTVYIGKTAVLPCEGVKELVTGCDTPKRWKLSTEAGAIAIGPEPGSTEWYASPADGLVEFQYDDRWSLTEAGEFIYDNNGSTMNPFEGFIETVMDVAPTRYKLELEVGPNGEPGITVNSMVTAEGNELCGWMGVWNAGSTFWITELDTSRMVLVAPQIDGDCNDVPGGGYFSLIFEEE